MAWLWLCSCLINSELYEERLAELLDQDGDGYNSMDHPDHPGEDCDGP